MKNIIYSIAVFCIFHCTLLIENCYAQWDPDLRLTNNDKNSYTSFNNARCIAANGNVIHAVWFDDRDWNWEIYYKRSTDGGVNWGAETRLTNNTALSETPSISVSGSNVHIVWDDDRDGNYEIYYKRSSDGGLTWGPDTRLTNNSSSSWYPSIAVSGSFIHAVWRDSRDGNSEIYYKLSTDGGINWGADNRLTNNTASSNYTSIAVNGSIVHVVWQDDRDGNSEIYYKHSTNGGVNWGADTRLTNNTDASDYSSIAVSGSSVHVVWRDVRDGDLEIYFKLSTDGGLNWGADMRVTNNPGNSSYPSVTSTGLFLNLVWMDYRDNNWEVYSKCSNDGGATWEADIRLTNNSSSVNLPSVSISGSNVHVVWQDNRDGNWEIYYKHNTVIPSAPVLISPANNSIGQPFSLNLIWNKPQHSTKFRVLVATDSLFANVIINDSLLTDSVKSISNLYPLASYYWKVSAGNGNPAGWSNFSQVYKFRTIGSPTQVILHTPVNNAVNQPVDITLRWFKAFDQTAKTRIISNYWVEYSTDSSFITGVVRDTTLIDSLKNVTGLNSLTKYFWRVKAKNVAGWGAFSSTWNFITVPPLGIAQIGTEIPSVYSLNQNYPNPFNPSTKIRFDVPNSDYIILVVFDNLGREISTPVNQQLNPGTYEVNFDGSSLSSGIYFYKITADEFSQTKKMVLVK